MYKLNANLKEPARQILEDHYSEKEIVLLGIEGQGIEVAKKARKNIEVNWEVENQI